MTFRHLQIFIHVADLGSMTAAAEALYITQPTVSQSIAELEQHYGVKLFDRLSRKLYITEAGRQLLGYARHITTLFGEMEQAVRDSARKGLLRVGASVTIGTSLLPGLVKDFLKEYPDIEIKAVTGNTKDMEALLLQNHIDFALVEGNIHTEELVAKPFMEDELALVCGREHPFYGKERISIFDLTGRKFVVREQGSGTRELFENGMEAHGVKWDLSWECNGSDGLKSAAAEGLGIGVISRRLVGKEAAEGSLHILKVEGMDGTRRFSIIHHKNKYLTEPMEDFFGLCGRRVGEQGRF